MASGVGACGEVIAVAYSQDSSFTSDESGQMGGVCRRCDRSAAFSLDGGGNDERAILIATDQADTLAQFILPCYPQPV